MKTTFAFLAGMLLAANSFAGSDTIIRQRARELSNQNNVRQGVPPPVQPGQPPASSEGGAPAPAQSPALSKLKADLAGITANAQVTLAQNQKIAQDILAVAQGPKPALATATKLAEEVSSAFSEKPLSAASLARFVQELDAVLNPSKYPQAKPEGIFADVQAIFQDNGLKRTKAVVISDGVKALAAEVKSGGR